MYMFYKYSCNVEIPACTLKYHEQNNCVMCYALQTDFIITNTIYSKCINLILQIRWSINTINKFFKTLEKNLLGQ